MQLVFAGCEGGHVFLWDFRGGRNSAAFVTPGEVGPANGSGYWIKVLRPKSVLKFKVY
jgi:hypothetical protein